MSNAPASNWLSPDARGRRRSLDTVVSLVVAVGIVGLFIFDISSPRGQVDGVGYAALVALCMRFGRRPLVAVACLTTFLTCLAAFLVPNAGITVEGELANRAFALISIWIVAVLLVRRLTLEDEIAGRETTIARHQDAILRIARESLSSDVPLERKIQAITEIAGEAVVVERTGVWIQRPGEASLRCADVWQRTPRTHSTPADLPINSSPGYYESVRENLIVVSNDVLEDPRHVERYAVMVEINIRAIISAGIFVDGRMLGLLSFSHVGAPRRWTSQETTFARSVASILALVFLESRHREALAALDLVGEAIYAEDVDGRLVYANKAARELAQPQDNLGAANAFPRPSVELSSPRDMHEIRSGADEFEIHRARLPGGGSVTRVDNVTARNVAVRERAQLEAKFQRAARMQALGQLAGGIAHDFNNLLGAILGFAGLLADDLPSNSTERGFVQRILSAGRSGKELVEQILAFARAGSVEHTVVDVTRLFRETQSLVSASPHKSVRWVFDNDDTELPVLARDAQIVQLITNLCHNAGDALGGKPGTVAASLHRAPPQELQQIQAWKNPPGEILVGTVDVSKPYVRIRVADSGEGMATDILARIFEPFFTTKGRQRGTGLGLAVVHGVVEAHNGACLVKSAPGQGTVFSVYLPLATDKRTPQIAPAQDQRQITGTERVLVVDDEADIADMLCIGLDRLGYQTIAVLDPLEAIAAFEEDPYAFDAVITDQVMPNMRGLDLVRKLKTIRPDIKTILCTGYSDSTNEEAARGVGVDVFVRKPVDARTLAPHLRNALEQRTSLGSPVKVP